MNFELSDDQRLLLTSVEGLLDRYRQAPHGEHGYTAYSPELQVELQEGGFLEIAVHPGYGPLEAAMLAEEVARCPVSAEVAASALIGPMLDARSGPIALAWGLGKPVRYLDTARTVCLFEADDVLVGSPSTADVQPNESVVAYPLATLASVPRDAVRLGGAEAVAIRRRALIGIAVEAAGLMRGALDLTVQYVKDRRQFGQALGDFQAIQHRLAEAAQLVQSARLLAFRAAWADNDRDAGLACLYAQQAIRKINYDCHQFTGAMGLTLEYPLHLWTYRLKFLQGEAGGQASQAAFVANRVWAGADAAGEGSKMSSAMPASVEAAVAAAN